MMERPVHPVPRLASLPDPEPLEGYFAMAAQVYTDILLSFHKGIGSHVLGPLGPGKKDLNRPSRIIIIC